MASRLLLLAILPLLRSALAVEDEQKAKQMAEKLPPCAACSAVVQSFVAGMERTAKGKFEGGDTSWEEKNLPHGYGNSELRLIEIQEKMCDIGRGASQCHTNHHLWEEKLEEWWKMDEGKRPDLKQWLCVEHAKACCPEGHFGPQCKPCSVKDASGKICSGNGKCKGSGTRKGSGKCKCDSGYGGELCDRCSAGFFQSYKDDDKLLCSECHKSCQSHCTGAGPKGCVSCKSGYEMHTEQGCQDVDECYGRQSSPAPCNGSQFCVNSDGSYKCYDCDKSCKTCFANGPDSCDDCAEGYVMKEGAPEEDDGHGKGVCVSEKTAGRIFNLSNTRYFTYLGLAVATCIISQRSTVVAGSLGLVVTAYVGLSEYYLQGATGGLQPVDV